MKKIIKNGIIIYGKELEIGKADILIQHNNIIEISDSINIQSAQIIDAKDCLVMLGLANAHLHSDENIFKAQYDNLLQQLV